MIKQFRLKKLKSENNITIQQFVFQWEQILMEKYNKKRV